MPEPKSDQKSINEPSAAGLDTSPVSINEPPGSQVEGFQTHQQPAPMVAKPAPGGRDPDELEEEIEAAEDEGDVEVTHTRSTTVKKKR